MMEAYLPTTDVRHLVLSLKFSQPKPVRCYKQMGKYSITPKRCGNAWIRTFVLELNSEGVSVCLTLQSTQHRLYRKDIVYGERAWLRLVQRQLARHGQAKSYRLIRGCLLGQLDALVFQDKEREHKESAQIRGSDLQLSYPDDTGLGLCRDTLSMVGSISELLG